MHSNGFTLARRALLEHGGPLAGRARPGARPHARRRAARADARSTCAAALDLLGSGVDVHGLAHITGDGLLNLLRLNDEVGYEIDAPLPAPADLRADRPSRAASAAAEMWEVFNMGTGFCCVVRGCGRRRSGRSAGHTPPRRRDESATVTAEAGRRSAITAASSDRASAASRGAIALHQLPPTAHR